MKHIYIMTLNSPDQTLAKSLATPNFKRDWWLPTKRIQRHPWTPLAIAAIAWKHHVVPVSASRPCSRGSASPAGSRTLRRTTSDPGGPGSERTARWGLGSAESPGGWPHGFLKYPNWSSKNHQNLHVLMGKPMVWGTKRLGNTKTCASSGSVMFCLPSLEGG